MLQNPALRTAIAISLGAIAGALSRYYLGGWIMLTFDLSFPIGTLSINLLGCFLMGLLVTLMVKTIAFSPDQKLLITTGVFGSLTTFSSYELETAILIDQPGWSDDILYFLGSPILGMLGFLTGTQIAQRIQQVEDQP
jgi:CrcB protein